MQLEDKITLPPVGLIHRRLRLLNLLETFVETKRSLITVYAQSGFGKSVLLADFAQTTALPVCWCSLEPSERNPAAFLKLLTYSLVDRFHKVKPQPILTLLEEGQIQQGVRCLVASLADVSPHLIIFDDYHQAVSTETTLVLTMLLEQLPQTSLVVVAAQPHPKIRAASALNSASSSRRLSPLPEQTLRFTPEEVQGVIHKRFGYRLDPQIAASLSQITGGNIAQILLTGRVIRTTQQDGVWQTVLGEDQTFLYHFLYNEVLDKQSLTLRRFLLYTAVLPEMTPQLCDELLETTCAVTHLDELIRQDLFISSTGAGYKYHDVFAEFLRAALAKQPRLNYQVTVKAATLLTQRDRFEEAVRLYFSVEAWPEAVNFFETYGPFFQATGQAVLLESWLAQLPEPVLESRPRLLLLRGQLMNGPLGQLDAAATYYQQAESRFRLQKDWVGAAEAQVFQSARLRMAGSIKEALVLAKQALDRLLDLNVDDAGLARALRNRGLAFGAAGNMAAALADVQQALDIFEEIDDCYQTGRSHHDLGVILVAQGNVRGGDHHYRRAIQIFEELNNVHDLINTLNSLSVSLYITGRYPEALEQFEHSFNLARQLGATRRMAFALAGSGDVHLATKQFDQARKAYARSTKFAEEAEACSLIIYNQIKVGECCYQQGNLSEALTLAGQAQEIATEFDLVPERGLATALQAKIYVRWAEYEASFALFQQALACFSGNDILEQAKVRLWWAYGLLLDQRVSAAFQQLEEVVRLTLSMGELRQGLGQTVFETQPVLFHFLHWPRTLPGMSDKIRLLLDQRDSEAKVVKPSVQFFAFGHPILVVDGATKFFSQRGRLRRTPEILAYILIAGQQVGCRRDEVITAIWPDLGVNQATTRFHQSIKRLRDAMFEAQDYILVQNDYYRINPLYFEWCDALAFDALFERISAVSPEEVLDLQLEFIELYPGEFLAGFDLGDWGTLYRSRCETRFLSVVKMAGNQLLKMGSLWKAVTVFNKGLQYDNFQEDLHYRILQAYAQLGLYGELTAHYNKLCVTFEQEMGEPPQPEIHQLYQQLKARR